MGRREWKVGDRGKWIPAITSGYSWNPPPPGWQPPTMAEAAEAAQLRKPRCVVIAEVAADGRPTKAIGDDGFVFDPSIDPRSLYPAEHEGWRIDMKRYGGSSS